MFLSFLNPFRGRKRPLCPVCKTPIPKGQHHYHVTRHKRVIRLCPRCYFHETKGYHD